MFIAGTKKGETSVNLATHLRDCEGGYETPEENDFLVNYGRTDLRYADLNPNLINNKLTQLQIFRREGLKVPNYYGIDWTRNREYPYPLIARKYYHCKGREAIFLRNRVSWLRRKKRVSKRHYFIKYIPKKTEFRVHVCGEEVIGISTKKPFEDMEQHPHIWSRDRGWCRINYDGEYNEKLSELGLKAIKALGYDFGAVDIMLGLDNQFYMLEVNSAPRLNRRRRKLYAKFFRERFNETIENR